MLKQRDIKGLLGHGPTTIADSGCTLLCLDEAAHRLHRRARDPVALSDDGCAKGGWGRFVGGMLVRGQGSLVVWDTLPGLAGLHTPWSERRRLAPGTPSTELAQALVDVFSRGGLALLNVDHDRARAGGDADPDHWVLALGVVPGGVAYYDPATGTDTALLELQSLRGKAGWGQPRRDYVALTLQPVYRAP